MATNLPAVYKPFPIWIRGTAEAADIAVDGAPGGDLPQAPLDLHQLPAVQQLVARMHTGVADPNTIVMLGQSLYNILFTSALRDLYQRSLGRLATGERLRLLLRIDPPALGALPWELLYDPTDNGFLALDPLVSLVRYLPQIRRPAPPLRSGPLRVLGVFASPEDLPSLQLGRELTLIVTALQTLPPDQVLLDVLIDGPTAATSGVNIMAIGAPTPEALTNAITAGYDVLHYGGHGMVGADGVGLLALENTDRSSALFDANSLGIAVRGTRLRLAVLTACQTAAAASPGKGPLLADRATDQTVADASRGAAIRAVAGQLPPLVLGPTPLPVAPTLVSAGLSAVVAMQMDLPDASAVAFSRAFYTAVARNAPIDTAMSDARKALRLTTQNRRGDWGIPVLFLQEIGDGRVWNSETQALSPPGQQAEEARWATATPQWGAGAQPGGNVVNSGPMGNVQTGSGTQWNVGSVAAGRDSYVGSEVDQQQYGGVRFGDNARLQGSVIGGNMIVSDFDAGTREELKALLEQLALAADDTRTLPRETRAAVMTQAEAAKQDVDAPDASQRLSERVQDIVKILKTVGEGITTAAPLYEILKNLGKLIGLQVP